MEIQTSVHDRQRIKTAQRIRYESESRVIREGFGGLEGIRNRLGLTQRQICQLLLIDPSAWSRWIKNEDRVPPHIYRALQWYVELETKDNGWKEWREWALKKDRLPEWDLWRRQIEKRLSERTTENGLATAHEAQTPTPNSSLEKENQGLKERVQKAETLSFAWKVLLLANTAWLLYSILSSAISFR